jgi:CRISPR-associated protein Cas1
MVRETKSEKILLLNPYGKFLSYSGMKFKVKNKKRNTQKEIDFYKVGQILLMSGNSVSVGALSSAGFWGIDVMILTASGKPVATLKALDDDSHVKTRICQYEAYKNRKGVEIAKQLVLGKIEAQTQLLRKYKLLPFISSEREKIKLLYAENIGKIRTKLTSIEGRYTNHYFAQIFPLFPKFLQISKREGYRAFDSLNNLFNISYETLRWRIHRAILKTKLEPFLGFLHRISHNHPTLISDMSELYRCLVDNFLIRYSQKLTKKDFEKQYERGRYNKKTARIYLNHSCTNKLIKDLEKYFETKVDIPRIRKGKRQSLDTLINEECSLLAMFLRGERDSWTPRIKIP